MKALICKLCFILCAAVHGQDTHKFDLRTGLGTSFLSTGNVRTVFSESEFNFYHGIKTSSSLSIAFGRSDQGISESTSFAQANFVTFYSPFGRQDRSDFRVGIGASAYKVSESYVLFSLIQDNVILEFDHFLERRSSLGLILAVEKSWQLSGSTLLALKAFTQPYLNGDTNSGILLKFGVAW